MKGKGAPALPDVIAAMPRSCESDSAPPYMPTLALLEALRLEGFPCELWNAVMESQWKILVVAGIRTQGYILDCNGQDPRNYPLIYPILQGAQISREGSFDIIPGKREQARKLFPEFSELTRGVLEYATLQEYTPDAEQEDANRRL